MGRSPALDREASAKRSIPLRSGQKQVFAQLCWHDREAVAQVLGLAIGRCWRRGISTKQAVSCRSASYAGNVGAAPQQGETSVDSSSARDVPIGMSWQLALRQDTGGRKVLPSKPYLAAPLRCAVKSGASPHSGDSSVDSSSARDVPIGMSRQAS